MDAKDWKETTLKREEIIQALKVGNNRSFSELKEA